MDTEKLVQPVSEPPKNDASPASSPEAMLDKIIGIEKQLEQTRRKQTVVSVLGVIGIIAVLGIFVLNLCTLVHSIDRDAVLTQLTKQASVLVSAPELQALQKDVREVFLPAYRKSLIENLRERESDFEKALGVEWDSTIRYLQKDVSKQFLARMDASFEKVSAQILKKYGNQVPSSESLEKDLDKLQKELLEQTTDVLAKEIGEAEKSLASLQGKILTFKDLPEYKGLEGVPTGEVENRLIETFLEIWIYELNPSRNTLYVPGEKKGGI